MLIGKEVIHEYRGRGTVTAVENGKVTVRFGDEYSMDFPYPAEFDRMLTLKKYDPEARQEIAAARAADRLARAEAYRNRKKEHE